MRHIRGPDGISEIGDSTRPMGSSPHPYFLLTRYLSGYVWPSDLELMLKDSCPAVRIAAAEIILWESRWRIPRDRVDVLLADEEPVMILEDCFRHRSSVAKVVAELRQNPKLFDREREWPNQALEPTPTSVTSPAAQESRQP